MVTIWKKEDTGSQKEEVVARAGNITIRQRSESGHQPAERKTVAKAGTVTIRRREEAAPQVQEATTPRKANLLDLAVGSVKRGYDSSRKGQEAYKQMMGKENELQKYTDKLEGEEYNFQAEGALAQGVSGAAEMLGQQLRQWTDKRSLTAAGGAAALAAAAGQAGPQVLTPEEVLTVPTAFAMGMKAGAMASNFEIEAGNAYLEMRENGISEDTAKKIALVVGGGNAVLEAVQLDELFKSFKVLDKIGVGDTALDKVKKVLKDRGVDVVKETAQEVAQEGVTVAGSQAASKIENGDWQYNAQEVGKRLGDTALSSALTFGVMNVPGGVRNVRAALQNQNTAKQPAAETQQAEMVTERTAPITERTAPITEQADPVTEQEAPLRGLSLPTLEDTEQPGQVEQDTPLKGLSLPTLEDAERQERMATATTELERTGIQYGVSDENIQAAKRISEVTGRNIVFFAEDAMEGGGMHNGYYDADTGMIWVNAKSKNPMAQIISHELTHSTEMAGAYRELSGLVLDRISWSGGDLAQMRKEKAALYARNGAELTDQTEIDKEIVAEYVEKHLLTDEQSILELAQQDRTLAQKILDWINGMLAKLGNQKAQEREFLQKARSAYTKALGETPGGVSQSRQSLRELRRAYAAGELTEEEFDTALDDIMQEESLREESQLTMQHSFAGENATTADQDKLRQARQMLAEGRDAETVRRETGWFRGMDGEWRFEIDDSGMEYHRGGDASFAQHHPMYARYQELQRQFVEGDIAEQDVAELRELDQIWSREFGRLKEQVDRGRAKLKDILDHKELFQAYPQLRNVDVVFKDLEGGTRGSYSPSRNRITLSAELRNAPQETLVHEVQHAIQEIEGFTGGSNRQYWEEKLRSGEQIYSQGFNEAMNRLAQFEADPQNAEAMSLRERLEAAGELDDDLQTYDAVWAEAEERGLADKINEYYDLRDEYYTQKNRPGNSVPSELYRNTAGEIEARDAADRRNMSRWTRNMLAPDRGDENTVFAERAGRAEEYIPGDISQEETQTGIRAVADMEPVVSISGGEFAKGEVDLITQVTEFFNSMGNQVFNPQLGDIVLDRKGVKDDLGHGIGRKKAAAFAAVPEVLRQGRVIDFQKNWKGRNYDTAVVAAPVSIGGVPHLEGVVLTRGDETNRFYVHEVLTTENGAAPFKTGTSSKRGLPGGDAPSVLSLLQQVKDVNAEMVEEPDKTEEVKGLSLPSLDDEGSVQHSISEEEVPGLSLPSVEEKSESAVDKLPTKARDYLRRAERAMVARIGEKMNVPRYAQREYLQEIARKISEEYLSRGAVSQETLNELFETAYDNGVVVEEEFYRQYKHVKDHLRTQAITISDQDKSGIADFESFRRSAFGTLRIVKENGLPVDTAYQELGEMAPDLFPRDITNPTDQLLRMFDVGKSIRTVKHDLDQYYGPDRETFREYARNDFELAVTDGLSELRAVKRYADERQEAVANDAPTTPKEAMQAYQQLKEARRTYEKAAAKNLLTNHDEILVGRLLRGEIELGALDPVTDNIRGITAVYEARKDYDRLAKLLARYKSHLRQQAREKADEYLKTSGAWQDKKAGILYSRETMERNIRDIVKDKHLADEIIQEYFAPVHDAQAEATRGKNRYRQRVEQMDLSRKVAEGNEVSEAHAVQLLGEAEDNIRMLENSRGRMKNRDGKTLSEWKAVVDELWKNNPNLDRAKINAAVREFRTIYDELFEQMNEVRVRNGYEPVNYRNGYFPHFQPGNGDGILAQFGKALGIDTQVVALPTTINGITHTFKPGITWFGNTQQRLGFATAYDAVEGFDKYIEGVMDVIHHTDNIQNLRAFLTEEEKEMKIAGIFEKGKFALGNFVVELDEYTNLLANKKSRADRDMEQAIGRRGYVLMKELESRVGANMVAINPGSWLTNFIPLTQGGAMLDRGMLLKGMWDTLRAYKEDDGIVDRSTFLTNRRGSDPLVKTWSQKASNKMGWPMEFIDQLTCGALVRGRYYHNLKQGMSETEAMRDADAWTASVMADRSKGATPTLFNRTNPITKAFTQFQLEVNNQFSYLFKDMPREAGERGKEVLAGMLLKFFLGAFIYNEFYEFFIGRRPALDAFGILNDTVGDLTGYELPNLVGLGVDAAQGEAGLEDLKTKREGVAGAGSNLAKTLLGELPFSSGLTMLGIETDGGRLPASNAIPDVGAVWSALTEESWAMSKRVKELGDEAWKLAYAVPPFGGGQIKKAWQGVKAVIEGGSYNVNAAGEKELQYPVFSDNPLEAAANLGRAVVFGKSSLPEAVDWANSGFKKMTAQETAAYQDMMAAGVTGKAAFELLSDLKAAEKKGDQSKETVQREILRKSDVDGEGRGIVYYAMLASDKERAVMDELADYGTDAGKLTDLLVDVKDAEKQGGKLRAIAEASLTDREAKTVAGMVLGTDMVAESGNPTTFAKLLEAIDTGLDASECLRLQADGIDLDNVVEMDRAGVSEKNAGKVLRTLAGLEPEAGKDTVTDRQKYKAVADLGLDDEETLRVFETIMGESEFVRVSAGYKFGVMPGTYAELKYSLPTYDRDRNGSFKQEEVTAAIRAMRGISTTQRAALWQMYDKGWSARKNPFSSSVGYAVKAAMDEPEGLSLPTP